MKLWPNLGGEEGRPSPALVPGHPLRAIGRAWSLLFGPGVSLLARVLEPGPAGRRAELAREARRWPVEGSEEARRWPAALGEEPAAPCWDWLEPAGTEALAWWPDDAARGELAARGLGLDAPDEATLHHVHDKAFTLAHAKRTGGLGGGLEELVTAFDPEALVDADAVRSRLARWPEWARAHWVLKPRLGSSGRGRLHSGEVREEGRLERALPRLASRGGAILEPWLPRVRDYSVQLVVHPCGRVESLGSLHQLVKPGGAVLGGAGRLVEAGRSRGAGEHHELLEEAALGLGRAAAARGFRGPCGVDSFAWTGPDGGLHLRTLCELNARFTTGHVAIGHALRAQAARRFATGRPWEFLLGGSGSGRSECELRPS